MKPTDTASDGFEWREDADGSVTVSRGEELRGYYEVYVREPALVAWSDNRTRVGLFIIVLYLLVAAVALLGLWREPSTSQARTYLTLFEDMAYPLGTTASGVDLAALIIHSTPYILVMVAAGGVWATGVAIVVGTLSGYKGGRVDDAMMAVSDFFMAIPGLPLVIVLALTFDPRNPIFVGMIITINYWAGLARSIRSQVLTIREDSYVEASRTMGVSTPRILFKDVIPNLMPYVTVNFVFAARYTIFASVGLYFIAVLPYSEQNWGVTLQYAYNSGALFSPSLFHWLLAPIVAIMGLTFGFMLLAQGMDRIFNPRVRTRLKGETESVGPDDEETTTKGMV